jgi:phytoene dehydrogenase-like protein
VEKFDAAIIGAGSEGLAAAITLARAGLRVGVFERNAEPGGRCQTIEFHPGFRASPFSDEVAPIPDCLFWSLDLAKRGVRAAAPATLTARWRDRWSVFDVAEKRGVLTRLTIDAASRSRAALANATAELPLVPGWRTWFDADAEAWPGEDWAVAPLADVVDARIRDRDVAAFAMRMALAGRAADPLQNGSALHLVARQAGSGAPRGGLGALGRALLEEAQSIGVKVTCGLEVTDIRRKGRRANGLLLADGVEIAAEAVLSTLDLKRTFLSLFKWEELPRATVQRANLFRFAPATARLLVALDGVPEPVSRANAARGPIVVSPDPRAVLNAYAAWRNGVLPEEVPLELRFVSATDPSLAPPRAATMTVTIGCMPYRFFDGTWTHAKRYQLTSRVLAAIDDVLPETSSRVKAVKLLAPPDIEDALGRTQGDLAGGEIAPDQMLSQRPWPFPHLVPPRTPIRGLYIAGPSTAAGTLATCASGVAAAKAIVADKRRRLFR